MTTDTETSELQVGQPLPETNLPIVITAVQTLHIEPGDALFVTVPEWTDEASMTAAKEYLAGALGCTVIVVQEGVRLEVVRQEEHE